MKQCDCMIYAWTFPDNPIHYDVFRRVNYEDKLIHMKGDDTNLKDITVPDLHISHYFRVYLKQTY